MNLEERRQRNAERLQRLADEHRVGVNLLPERIERLTQQVFEGKWPTREAFEEAWEEFVEELIDQAETELNKQKLTKGTGQLAGQLSLV